MSHLQSWEAAAERESVEWQVALKVRDETERRVTTRIVRQALIPAMRGAHYIDRTVLQRSLANSLTAVTARNRFAFFFRAIASMLP